MSGPRLRNERMGGLFLLGVLAFNPPLLDVFDAGEGVMVFGVPLLYVYLFLAWAVLIALMALVLNRPVRGGAKSSALSVVDTEPEDD